VSQIARLVCMSGPDAGTEYELSTDTTQIGRSANADVNVNDGFASRQHAELHFIDNAYRLHDLGSKNGVFVNGGRLGPGATIWLEDGDELQFASTRFRFHDPSATITAPFLEAVQRSGIRVEPATRQVFVDGEALVPPLSVKQFDLLLYLYQNRGRVVSKDELAKQIWAEVSGDVYDASIDRMVSRVRSRIETAAEGSLSRFIVTVRGYGYQLTDQ
jgi:DNA-binding winged helix-turn-helix (wHTH) protein